MYVKQKHTRYVKHICTYLPCVFPRPLGVTDGTRAQAWQVIIFLSRLGEQLVQGGCTIVKDGCSGKGCVAVCHTLAALAAARLLEPLGDGQVNYVGKPVTAHHTLKHTIQYRVCRHGMRFQAVSPGKQSRIVQRKNVDDCTGWNSSRQRCCAMTSAIKLQLDCSV